jgi:hypothetical protein
LLELFTENGLELLEHLAGVTDVLDDEDHVIGLHEDLFGVAEFPTGGASGGFNLDLGLVVLSVPLLKDDDGLVDSSEGALNRLLVENSFDIDFHAYFGADFVGDAFENVLELFFFL